MVPWRLRQHARGMQLLLASKRCDVKRCQHCNAELPRHYPPCNPTRVYVWLRTGHDTGVWVDWRSIVF